jgi:hypothetical protein
MCWPAEIVVALHIETNRPSRNRVRHLACQYLFTSENSRFEDDIDAPAVSREPLDFRRDSGSPPPERSAR